MIPPRFSLPWLRPSETSMCGGCAGMQSDTSADAAMEDGLAVHAPTLKHQ